MLYWQLLGLVIGQYNDQYQKVFMLILIY